MSALLLLQEDDEMTVAYVGITRKEPLLRVKIREQLQHSDWELF